MINKKIDNVIAEILEHLSTLALGNKEYVRLVWQLDEQTIFPGLAWLSSQACYPQFYWYQRTGAEECSALGRVKSFCSIEDAEYFLSQNPQIPDVRLWGLNGWNAVGDGLTDEEKQQATYCFLPRLEIHRLRSTINVNLNIDGKDDIQAAILFLSQLTAAPDVSLTLSASITEQKHIPCHDEWCRLLNCAISDMKAGKMEKVVMARETQLTLSNAISVAELLSASQQVNHYCYHFMMAFDKHSGFISSTPERLYLRQGTQLNSEALAGTVANDPDDNIAAEQAKWLMEDKKNQHENLVVVDDICQQLQGAVTGVDVSSAKVIRLRKIQHLYRSIVATLIEPSDSDCLQRLQPTAAVCGLPRQAARQFLAKNEPFSRGWYAGTGGFISLNKSEFAVSLRCAQINGSQVSLYSGAGIVRDSAPEQEWEEIENKAAGLKSLFGNG
ncbi:MULTISPECIES: isochorismate synthase [Providencia]|uniref:isochorismate synthase n=1 Tax=Providencia TaxID=586 RepID=UPI001981FC2B|nr:MULTISPECIES: isochorismate synthase [Providencia]MBN4863536.1 isochorismate synthase [Providencia stuartii]MBN4872858.1 isochorismate synthase [Providencia stuartii]MBN4878021.1 isochorismate synthase [Providencia stuartii]MBN4882059.1 isochorismate synthase [Providencia stuartii]